MSLPYTRDRTINDCSDPQRSLTSQDAWNTVNRVFERLDTGPTPYALLRNRDRVPAGLLEGSDVDVVVPNTCSFGDLEAMFWDLNPIHIIRQQPGTGIKFYFPAGDGYVSFDFLNGDREWLGARYLSNETLLRDRILEDGIPATRVANQALDAWVAGLFWSKHVKPRYAELLRRAAEEQRDELEALLVWNFGSSAATQIRSIFSSPYALKPSLASVRKWKVLFWTRAFFREPIRTARRLSSYVVRRITFRLQPPGVSLTILGPDGAGKTMVSSELSHMGLPVIPFSSVTWLHLHKHVLPTPRALRSGRFSLSHNGAPNLDPHAHPPHSPFLSLFLAAYSLIDQYLSHVFWERRRLAQNRLVVHDRHLMELAVDPARYRFGGPVWVARLLGRLAPQPNLTILLDAPAEVLQSRKREVPYAETERQRKAYRDLVASLPNGQIVDADQQVDRVVEDVKQIILRFVAQRTKRKFNGRSRPRVWAK